MEIYSKASGPAGKLSNFTAHPFNFRGVDCLSMEGLLQSLKFQNPDMQKEVCKMSGLAAKRKGAKKNWQRRQTLYWQGKEIKRDSDEYQLFLDEAFEALSKNKKFAKTLLATNNSTFTHSRGKKKKADTVLTTQEFCSRLSKLRDKLKEANN